MMPTTLRTIPAPRRASGLLAGCALAAIAALPGTALAQEGLKGNPTVVVSAPNVPVITTEANYTGVFVRAPQTVINWQPFDTAGAGTIDFLPAGAIAEFSDPGGLLGNFTVLNRILPVDGAGNPVSRAIALNGTVIGLAGNAPGGQIWFYSPTGIIAGPTSLFNVGSLILTTNDIQFVADNPGGSPPTTGSIYGAGGLVQFRGPVGSTGFVQVQPGARINATGTDAYVALVAPRVVQGGTVDVNGQVAFLAAEQLDMTINAGLFDFTLLVGTTDANGVVHTGITRGGASTGVSDAQRISMVALPKLTALTMLLSGSVGYTPAASAFDDGSAIVLAAGFISGNPGALPASQLGNIQVGNTTFRNKLDAYASNSIAVAPTGGTVDFQGATRLFGVSSITMTAETAEEILGTSLSLNAGGIGTGGTATLLATGGGRIALTERLDVIASSNAATYAFASYLDGTGGTVTVTADSGSISAPTIFLNAAGQGGSPGMVGGTGRGGTITARVTNGGTLTADTFVMFAGGVGGYGPIRGGDGIGGTISLIETNGQLALGTVSLTANGIASFSDEQGGDATSGRIDIALNNQAQTWTSLSVNANAAAGFGSIGSGTATGLANAVSLTMAGPASLTIEEDLVLHAGAVAAANTAPGTLVRAGGVAVTVGQEATLAVGGTIETRADVGYGVEGPATSSTTAPDVQGGTVTITSRGTLTAAGLIASADATGASADLGAATVTGGTVIVTAADGGSIGIDDGTGGGALALSANAFGMAGPMPAHAQGGTARLIADGGSIIALGALNVEANARAHAFPTPPAGPGFDATGGTASVELRDSAMGTSSISARSLSVSAIGDARNISLFSGEGGGPSGQFVSTQGEGGDGTGGNASIVQAAGALTTGSVTLDASGFGSSSAASNGPDGFRSGDGFGGTARLDQTGGTATLGTLELLSNGIGGGAGGGTPPATGSQLAALAGDGTGGTATLNLVGGSLDAATTTIEAIGFGGAGMNHDGGTGVATDGGIGTGGTARLQSADGWAGSFTTGALTLRGNGTGGTGGVAPDGTSGASGDGIGTNATVALADGAFSLGDVTVEAIGTGGDGEIGGDAAGGRAEFSLVDTTGPTGARSLASLFMDSSAFPGENNGGGFGLGSPGDTLLTVRPLNPASAIDFTGNLDLFSTGGSSLGTGGIVVAISGAPLTVGGRIQMSATRDVEITADQALRALGQVGIGAARFVTSTGLVQSGGVMFVGGSAGVTAERLVSGSTTTLFSLSGAVSVAELLSAGEVTAQGASLDIRSTGALQFLLAEATAGDVFIETVGDLGVTALTATGSVTLQTTAGNIATGDFNAGTWAYVDAAGSATLGNIVATTDVGLTTRAGNLTVGNVTAGDEIWLSVFGTDPTRLLTAGNLVSTGLGDDDADGPPVLFGGPGPSGRVIRVRSSGSLALGDVQTPGRAILVADAGTMSAGNVAAPEAIIALGRGDIALGSAATAGLFYVADSSMFPSLPDAYSPASIANLAPVRTSGGLTVGGAVNAANIVVGVAGNAVAPSWSATGRLLIDSGGQFISAGAVTAGGSASLTADGGITLASLTAGGNPFLQASNGLISVANLLTFGGVTARARGIDIASTGALFLQEATATAGGVRLLATGELVTGLIGATGLVDLRSANDYMRATGNVTGGTIRMTAFGRIEAGANLVSASTLTIDAGGSFILSGSARGTSVSVLSSDIALGATAAIGSRGLTTDITLVNRDPARTMFIGGAANTAGYSLDQAEAARLFADNSITLGTALAGPPPPAGQGTIVVGDLAMGFGANRNLGTGGELEISTPGRVSIIGRVALTTSGATDTFTIDPSLIELDTTTGSIAMLDGNGAALGRLAMVGGTVSMATTATLAQLATLTDFAAIKALLDAPGGIAQPIRAGTIDLSVTNALYVQNTGASGVFADRRGFQANALNITTANANTRIAINGQILTAGGPVSGLDTVAQIRINGLVPAAGGRFDAASTVNGCVIGANCAFVPPPPPPPRPNPPGAPTGDDIGSPLPPGDGGGALLIAPLIELAATDPLIAPPLVDEPITGVGNDDLWQPRCEDPEDDSCPEVDEQP